MDDYLSFIYPNIAETLKYNNAYCKVFDNSDMINLILADQYATDVVSFYNDLPNPKDYFEDISNEIYKLFNKKLKDFCGDEKKCDYIYAFTYYKEFAIIEVRNKILGITTREGEERSSVEYFYDKFNLHFEKNKDSELDKDGKTIKSLISVFKGESYASFYMEYLKKYTLIDPSAKADVILESNDFCAHLYAYAKLNNINNIENFIKKR